jgi:phosphatidylethanolamine/phosphatidyl-N-methylethanolamine N-methyltransferase
MSQSNSATENEVFFKHWLRSPKSMGSIIPSSGYLARALAAEVAWEPGSHVIELGGGTGAITQGLLERGIPAANLVVIELETNLYNYLAGRYPDVKVVQGDATRLDEIIARLPIERVSTVISGLPMVRMPLDFKRAIIDQAFAAMPAGHFMLQYTYSPLAPVPVDEFNLDATLARYVVRNFPPAAVWRYRRRA